MQRQFTTTHHLLDQGGSRPATTITMQHRQSSTRPWRWEAVSNMDVNNNQMQPTIGPTRYLRDLPQPEPSFLQPVYYLAPHQQQRPPHIYMHIPDASHAQGSGSGPAHQIPPSLRQQPRNVVDQASASSLATSGLKPPECPVCMEPLQSLSSPKEAMVTPCGHPFCNICLNKALRIKNECPTCRKNVMGMKDDGARRIFL